MASEDAPTSNYVLINGTVVPRDEARISVFDHGFLYGDGCFESVIVTNHRVLLFGAHSDRLRLSLRGLEIDFDVSDTTLLKDLNQLLIANGLKDSWVKIVVTRGVGQYPMLDPGRLTPTLVIFAEAVRRLPAADAGQAGVRLRTSSMRRTPPWSLDPKIKSLNYLNPILARKEAQRAGGDDALLLDELGNAAEASASNIWALADGRLTRSSSPAALKGVTQRAVELIAENLGIPWESRALTTFDLYSAQELFLTSTAGGIIPIIELDGRTTLIPAPGPTTAAVARAYEIMLTDPAYSTDVRDADPEAQT
ncbi:MAG TPA: aminotransferase class IV [Candidatus Dormibacteraeota bacterium]|nr:aminotransferase class IV [Candidatus Dormibacteraeota bacterium]